MSLDAGLLSLASPDGQVSYVLPNAVGSRASLFQKANPFESFVISVHPDEAGLENEWLTHMGSSRFEPILPTEASENWCAEHCVTADKHDLKFGTENGAFNALPYLYERPSFVIPMDLPPWTDDMIEDAFVRILYPAFAGCSLCLAEDAAVS